MAQNIKIGDTVRFLNDIGGGKVVGFNGQSEVVVEQEDGFGFPISVLECVVVSSASVDKKNSAPETKQESSVTQAAQSYGNTHNNPNQLKVYLAFVPTDIDSLESSNMDLYLINNSDYSLFFSLLETQNKGSKCRKNSLVRPNENLFIEQVKRTNLGSLEHLSVQIIALKGAGVFDVHKPIDRSVDIKIVKFFKSTSYSFSSFLGCDAMTIDLCKDQQKIDMEALKESFADKQKEDSSPKVQKHSPSNSQMLEIDLHIDSLLDSTKGMSSGDMLDYQITYFKKIMSENERFTGKKIIFIHGKGDGVLRSSLERELKRMGLGNRYQQASFKKYGYGAIMVII